MTQKRRVELLRWVDADRADRAANAAKRAQIAEEHGGKDPLETALGRKLSDYHGIDPLPEDDE